MQVLGTICVIVDNSAPTPPVTDHVHHTAHVLLAIRAFGLVSTRTVTAEVGPEYVDNSIVVTLAALHRQGPMRPRDLDDVLGLSSPNVSRILDRLEASGDLVRRSGEVADDHRAVLLSLTPVGKRRVRAISDSAFTDAAALTSLAKDAAHHLEALGVGSSPGVGGDEPVTLCEGLGRLGLTLRAVLLDIAGDVAGALTLCVLATSDGQGRPTSIVDHVGLTSGGATKVLDRLESSGLIERSFGTSSDRRSVELRLTPAGRNRLDRMADDIAPHLAELHIVLVSVLRLLERRSG